MTDLSAFPIARRWPPQHADRIQLYSLNTPNGVKASIMLEETGLPYEAHLIDFAAEDQKTDAFRSLNPNGKIPALIDPDGPGGRPLALFESGAILLYLAEKTGRFIPADPRGRVAVTEWLMWQMGGLGPMLGQNHHFNRYAPEKIPYAIDRYVRETARLYGVLDRRLADRAFVAGDYSIADMACYPWIVPHELQQQDLADFPHVKRWFDRIAARPATIEAYAKGQAITDANVIDEDEAKRNLFGTPKTPA